MALRRKQQADKDTDAPQPAGRSNSSTESGCAGSTRGDGGPLRHLMAPAMKKVSGRAAMFERSQSTETSAGSSLIYKRKADDTATGGVMGETSPFFVPRE